MASRSRTVLLTVICLLLVVVVVGMARDEDGDSTGWRALAGILRLLAAIGRVM